MLPPGSRLQLSRAARVLPLLLAVAAGSPLPLRAQGVFGRWAVLLKGGTRGELRGELRLDRAGDTVAGTIWLENHDRPLPIHDARLRGDNGVGFTADADGSLRFTAQLGAAGLQGTARADSGPSRPWQGWRIPARDEYYPVLPRFTLREMVVGNRESAFRLPGPWLAAGALSPAELDSAYALAAARAGLTRYQGARLAEESPLRASGVADRQQVVAASRRTLTAIRSGLPDSATPGFDRIFRPRGAWITDFYDAALARGAELLPGLTWAAAVPALQAVGWAARDSTVSETTVALLIYRLYSLAGRDTAQAARLLDGMRRAAPGSATDVAALLAGCKAAAAWDATALGYLLDAPWFRDGDSNRSLGDSFRASWHEALDTVPAPFIAATPFGYPQAVPRFGVPGSLLTRLATPDNWPAREWLARHGNAGLLRSLQWLPRDTGSTLLVTGSEGFRLASVPGLSAENGNGFLEPADRILVEPTYPPLLALQAVVHEWEHLAFERVRRLRRAADTGAVAVLPAANPFVAEGVAEWRAERVMAPWVARFPLLGFAEVEKRARLAAARDDDPHVVGYGMVRALARAVPDPARRLELLVVAADDPAAIARSAELARAWRGHAAAPDRLIAAPSRRALVPETTFTLEDGYPDVVETRILVPEP